MLNNDELTGPSRENLKMFFSTSVKPGNCVFSWEHTALPAKSGTLQFIVIPSKRIFLTLSVRYIVSGFRKIDLRAFAKIGRRAGDVSVAVITAPLKK